ncbi:MAG TPA: hypothetical protein H9671_06930 [Firmicutes bacterium]|nr:hypothetical protein [Bacillota bacterium]
MPYLLHQTNEVLTTLPDIDGTLGAVILRGIGISIVSMHRTSWQPFTWLKVKVTPFGGFTGIKSISPNMVRLTLGGYSVCCQRAAFCHPVLSDLLPIPESRGQAPPDRFRRGLPETL